VSSGLFGNGQQGWYAAVDPHSNGDSSVNRRGKETDPIIGGKVLSFFGSAKFEGGTNATQRDGRAYATPILRVRDSSFLVMAEASEITPLGMGWYGR